MADGSGRRRDDAGTVFVAHDDAWNHHDFFRPVDNATECFRALLPAFADRIAQNGFSPVERSFLLVHCRCFSGDAVGILRAWRRSAFRLDRLPPAERNGSNHWSGRRHGADAVDCKYRSLLCRSGDGGHQLHRDGVGSARAWSADDAASTYVLELAGNRYLESSRIPRITSCGYASVAGPPREHQFFCARQPCSKRSRHGS